MLGTNLAFSAVALRRRLQPQPVVIAPPVERPIEPSIDGAITFNGQPVTFVGTPLVFTAGVIEPPEERDTDAVITFNGQPVTFNGAQMVFTAGAFAAAA